MSAIQKTTVFYDVLGTRTLPKHGFRRLLRFRRFKKPRFLRCSGHADPSETRVSATFEISAVENKLFFAALFSKKRVETRVSATRARKRVVNYGVSARGPFRNASFGDVYFFFESQNAAFCDASGGPTSPKRGFRRDNFFQEFQNAAFYDASGRPTLPKRGFRRDFFFQY